MHKLLLADDSVTIQRVIELTFSGEDIDVVAVNDGEQAIARIPDRAARHRPGRHRHAEEGRLRRGRLRQGPRDLEHIPVLLLAGAFEPVDQARAEQVRCDGVLIKPFEPRQVIERVRELLEGMKGSPAQATADVPRPVDRLSPRQEPQAVPPPVAAPAQVDASAPMAMDASAAILRYRFGARRVLREPERGLRQRRAGHSPRPRAWTRRRCAASMVPRTRTAGARAPLRGSSTRPGGAAIRSTTISTV